MKAQYTPGPWEHDLTGKYYQPCVRHNGMIVCTMPKEKIGLNGVDERLYDARLIAAAPEMYWACKHASMSIHHPACKCKGERMANPELYCTCHVQKALIAVNKAEGK